MGDLGGTRNKRECIALAPTSQPWAPLCVGANFATLGSSMRWRQLRNQSSSKRWRQPRNESSSMRRRQPRNPGLLHASAPTSQPKLLHALAPTSQRKLLQASAPTSPNSTLKAPLHVGANHDPKALCVLASRATDGCSRRKKFLPNLPIRAGSCRYQGAPWR